MTWRDLGLQLYMHDIVECEAVAWSNVDHTCCLGRGNAGMTVLACGPAYQDLVN